MKYIAILFIALLFAGCTPQQIAKGSGGTANINLPPGTKLVTATWKETNVWYLTRPMRTDETPETSVFKESSSWGIIQGTVVFKESR